MHLRICICELANYAYFVGDRGLYAHKESMLITGMLIVTGVVIAAEGITTFAT